MSDVPRSAAPSGAGSHLPGALGQGTLGRATALVYWYVVVTALLALAALPTLALLLLLDRAASNVPLAALAALPLGPALSAALYAVRARETDDEVAPARTFVRGYRRGAPTRAARRAPRSGCSR